MGRILLGDRNTEHRALLKARLMELDPSLSLISAGNTEDILRYLIDFPLDQPLLIILDPSIPSPFEDKLVSIIKSDLRFSHIPLVIWTDHSGSDYYAARATGLVAYSIVKPSRPDGWKLLAEKIYELATKSKYAAWEKEGQRPADPTENAEQLPHTVVMQAPNAGSDKQAAQPPQSGEPDFDPPGTGPIDTIPSPIS